MKTYFIRHTQNLDIDEKTFNILIKKKLIAIHYPFKSNIVEKTDCTSTNPDDYELASAKSAMRIFGMLSKEGGYVCAEYRTRDGALIGIVKPQTPIILLKGNWGTQRGRKAVLKTLQLERVQHIDSESYLKVSFARPIQGTICRWSNVGKRIESLVNKSQFAPALEDLSPVHQEVLCSEYLRSGIDPSIPLIQNFLLPIGRTLKDIDIYGITRLGQKVYGQVTYRSLKESTLKLQKLKKYRSKNSFVILFCKSEDITHKEMDGIQIYSIEKVFSVFTKTPIGKIWLKSILE